MNGVTNVGYSTSYCWTQHYCLGLLTWLSRDSQVPQPSQQSLHVQPHWACKTDKHTNRTARQTRQRQRHGPRLTGASCRAATATMAQAARASSSRPMAPRRGSRTIQRADSAGTCDDTRYTLAQSSGATSGAAAFARPAPASTTAEEDPQWRVDAKEEMVVVVVVVVVDACRTLDAETRCSQEKARQE
ncbi:hypothetical protein BD289DRAFT_256116 [Coniella lustricola]|uniref:Uncharacterized protein n=1 Tax=Coniella lustricola TaxID=2025994 RepID=A0A2T3AKT2_9PEZI|nr:hypothetical protein BD289DRAFT_256116 [Coniella lustricola]